MSELKAEYIDDLFCEFYESGMPMAYLKDDVDKVLAELIEKNERLSNDCLIEKEIRHHKYKRCVAMASKCRLRARWFGDNAFYKKEQWALQWHRRWLELAEKFKEVK